MALRITLLILALALPSAALQTPGSFDGTVVVLGTSTPVPRATVTVSKRTGDARDITVTATDAGKFSLTDLAPGDYLIDASHEGFQSSSRGSRLTVASGGKTGVTIELVPDGAISGHIVDSHGYPVAGSVVQALKYTYWTGQRILSVVESTRTNDLGEYRIYWLPPDRYFLSSNASPTDRETSLNSHGAIPSIGPLVTPGQEQVIPTYFPGTVDVTKAAPIDLRAGETFSGGDIRMSELRKVKVGGVVTNPIGRGVPTVRLESQNIPLGPRSPETDADAASGAFEFKDVVPGPYFLTADLINSDGVLTFGRVAIDVADSDIENVAVTLSTGFDIRVQMTIDGRARTRAYPQLVLNLHPSISMTPAPTVERDGNDAFLLHHVMPGDYTISLPVLSDNFYLKSAQFGSTDALAGGLHIDVQPAGVLDVVVADDAGTVSGIVLDEKKQPVSGVTVVLVPEFRSRIDLYKTVIADDEGHVELSGVAPGQYKAFSWERVEPFAWRYPEFLGLYEDRGQLVHIDGGRSVPISLTLIPPRN